MHTAFFEGSSRGSGLAVTAALVGLLLVAAGCGSDEKVPSSPDDSHSASASASTTAPSAMPSTSSAQTESPAPAATTDAPAPELSPTAAESVAPAPTEPKQAPATYAPTQHPQSTRGTGQQIQQGGSAQTPQNQNPQGGTGQTNAPASVEGSEGPVNSGDEAIAVIRKAWGNKENYHYTARQEMDLSYTVQVTDPELQAQGGTGMVGVFTVKPDGTYRMQ